MIQPILMPAAVRRSNGFPVWDGPIFYGAGRVSRIAQAASLRLMHRAGFEEEAIRQHGGGNVADVFGRHPPSEETVAPVLDHLDDPITIAYLNRRKTA